MSDVRPPDVVEVATLFGLGEPLGPPVYAARGELGRIWRVETALGPFAVKEMLSDDPGDGRADVAFQLALADAGVPLPRPVLTPAGDVVRRAGGVAFRVYEWVELDPSARVPDDVAGAQLAGIHDVGHPAGRTDPWYTEPVGGVRWRRVIDAALATNEPWAPALRGLEPELLAAERVVTAGGSGGPRIRCHLDYNPENVALDTAGRPVVLDWENSGGAHPEAEVAQAAWEFSTWQTADDADARARRFVEGYRGAGGRFAPADVSVFAMAFAVQGHLLEHYATRALDERADPEGRARAVRWLGEMTARPLTLAAAGHLLDVVG